MDEFTARKSRILTAKIRHSSDRILQQFILRNLTNEETILLLTVLPEEFQDRLYKNAPTRLAESWAARVEILLASAEDSEALNLALDKAIQLFESEDLKLYLEFNGSIAYDLFFTFKRKNYPTASLELLKNLEKIDFPGDDIAQTIFEFESKNNFPRNSIYPMQNGNKIDCYININNQPNYIGQLKGFSHFDCIDQTKVNALCQEKCQELESTGLANQVPSLYELNSYEKEFLEIYNAVWKKYPGYNLNQLYRYFDLKAKQLFKDGLLEDGSKIRVLSTVKGVFFEFTFHPFGTILDSYSVRNEDYIHDITEEMLQSSKHESDISPIASSIIPTGLPVKEDFVATLMVNNILEYGDELWVDNGLKYTCIEAGCTPMLKSLDSNDKLAEIDWYYRHQIAFNYWLNPDTREVRFKIIRKKDKAKKDFSPESIDWLVFTPERDYYFKTING